ncbi:MAG TPA: phosphoribosylanthranilate isomerase [Chthoniobacterales bacterium]|jgi:phosphoribosylanthranilate isomerase
MRNLFERIAPGAVGAKVCGITNPEDADFSIRAGADALGFNFFPGSKRYLELDKEREWLAKIPETVLRVAVVVNPTREEALALLAEPFIDALQLHGDEGVGFAREMQQESGKIVIKALRVKDAAALAAVEEFAEFPVLLDAFAGHERGGTGQTFDWTWLRNLSSLDGVLLSGGLNPRNVAEALRLTNVRYVDVASGVEDSPRTKSPAKVQEFLSEVRK